MDCVKVDGYGCCSYILSFSEVRKGTEQLLLVFLWLFNNVSKITLAN